MIEVLAYDSFAGEFLLLHRYGYVSKNSLEAGLYEVVSACIPSDHDPKDDLFDFNVKPQSAYTKVEHEIATTHVKAKFERTSKNRVPTGTVLSG